MPPLRPIVVAYLLHSLYVDVPFVRVVQVHRLISCLICLLELRAQLCGVGLPLDHTRQRNACNEQDLLATAKTSANKRIQATPSKACQAHSLGRFATPISRVLYMVVARPLITHVLAAAPATRRQSLAAGERVCCARSRASSWQLLPALDNHSPQPRAYSAVGRRGGTRVLRTQRARHRLGRGERASCPATHPHLPRHGNIKTLQI